MPSHPPKPRQAALVDLPVQHGQVEANVEKICGLIDELSGTDLIVFPELAMCGYVPTEHASQDQAAAYQQLARGLDDDPLMQVRAAARAAAAYVAVGFSEKTDTGPPYNSIVLIDPEGEAVGIHRKVHPWAHEDRHFARGATFDVFDTALGKVGMSLCYDSRFPSNIATQASAGATFLICSYALQDAPDLSAVDSLLRRASTRALENQAWFLACNRAGIDEVGSFPGGSITAAPTGRITSTTSQVAGITVALTSVTTT